MKNFLSQWHSCCRSWHQVLETWGPWVGAVLGVLFLVALLAVAEGIFWTDFMPCKNPGSRPSITTTFDAPDYEQQVAAIERWDNNTRRWRDYWMRTPAAIPMWVLLFAHWFGAIAVLVGYGPVVACTAWKLAWNRT